MQKKKRLGNFHGRTMPKNKAQEKEELRLISNIFVEDKNGKKLGGFKSISDAESLGLATFICIKDHGVFLIKN